MIIGFDGSRAFQEGRTGTENYSFQLLKALAKIDRENTYIIFLRPHSVILNPKGEGSLANARPTFVGDSSLITQNDNYSWPENFRFKTINWPRLWTQGGLALQTFRDKLDILFVPAHTLPVIRRPGLKTVVTVHDLGSEYLPGMHQVKQRLYLGFMQRHQLKTATKIIAVSKATKEDLVKRIGIDPKKVSVVYEGYDREKFQIPKSKYQKDRLVNSLRQYGVKPGNYFLFVGTVQPRKNLERLIKAFAEFLEQIDDRKWKVEDGALKMEGRRWRKKENLSSNFNPQDSTLHSPSSIVKLVIAGSKGWLSDEIYELPKKLGIEERVKFLGYVPDENLPALYSGAAALTFPSLFEGFGLPILEAQACGCSVITSNVSSMPEVAGPGALYVNPASLDDIVRGLGEVGEFREKIIKAGFENVKKFSWEKCAKETLEVLEDI